MACFEPESEIISVTEDGRAWVSVKLREGRKREIRRVFYQIKFKVMILRRVAIGEGDNRITLNDENTTAEEEVKGLGSLAEHTDSKRKKTQHLGHIP